jgi:LacI family transcriptional regulator
MNHFDQQFASDANVRISRFQHAICFCHAVGCKVNLEDIARMAGVSRSTVSRVVNNDPRVSDAVRQRVSEIIERSHYHPNAAARSLASRKTRIIGLLIPQEIETIFVDSWFASLIKGCVHACRDHDLSVMLMMELSNDLDSVERVVQRTVRGQHLDGLIISSSFVDDILVKRLSEERFPYVLIGRDHHNIANYVDVDNRGAARAAVKHLLQHGRTVPAMIAGPDSMVAANDRRDGFLDAVTEAGIDPANVPIRHIDWSQQAAYRVALELFDEGWRPDAIFAASDSMAVGVIQAVRARGLSVPEDVGVSGFDDINRERTVQMGLSTIEQPLAIMARTAVELLIAQQTEFNPEPSQRVLPTKLVRRSSCGCLEPGEELLAPDVIKGNPRFLPRDQLVVHHVAAP